MYPLLTVVTHYPFFAVVSSLKIYLLAVEAKELFFVLFDAIGAKVLRVVWVGQVIFSWLVRRTYLVAADIQITWLGLFRRGLANLRL